MSTTALLPAEGSTALTSQAMPAPLGKAIQRHAKRALDQVAVNTAVAVATERGRAALTDEALHNAGALSALEAHLIKVAPLGEARYRAIADAYAIGASEAIMRWGR